MNSKIFHFHRNRCGYRRVLWVLIAVLGTMPLRAQADFELDQRRHVRVEHAFRNVEESLRARFAERGLHYPPEEIYLRAFKKEGTLEVWVRDGEHYKVFNIYSICELSGDYGPKRMEGDLQVPEGFYRVDRFNPVSNFHLSLGIDYPNEADRRRNQGVRNPGGDIFIHGSCVTVGCIPVTDAKIEEVYVLAVKARAAGQQDIPIHIFPFRFDLANQHVFYREYPQYAGFWDNLKFFYNYFELRREIPDYVIKDNGDYVFATQN